MRVSPIIVLSLFSRKPLFGGRNLRNFSKIFQPTVIDFLDAKDIPALSTLAKETYAQTYPTDYSNKETLEELFGENYVNKILPLELKSKNYFYLVCKNGGNLVGYAKLVLEKELAILDKLYLLHNFQGFGYGRQLLLRCYEIALEHGAKKMTLIAYEENQRAVDFYIHHGFDPGEKKPHLHLVTRKPTNKFHYEMTCENMEAHLTTKITHSQQ